MGTALSLQDFISRLRRSYCNRASPTMDIVATATSTTSSQQSDLGTGVRLGWCRRSSWRLRSIVKYNIGPLNCRNDPSVPPLQPHSSQRK